MVEPNKTRPTITDFIDYIDLQRENTLSSSLRGNGVLAAVGYLALVLMFASLAFFVHDMYVVSEATEVLSEMDYIQMAVVGLAPGAAWAALALGCFVWVRQRQQDYKLGSVAIDIRRAIVLGFETYAGGTLSELRAAESKFYLSHDIKSVSAEYCQKLLRAAGIVSEALLELDRAGGLQAIKHRQHHSTALATVLEEIMHLLQQPADETAKLDATVIRLDEVRAQVAQIVQEAMGEDSDTAS